MKNGKPCEACSGLGLLMVRGLLGSVLLLAGYSKLFHGGVAEFVDNNTTTAE